MGTNSNSTNSKLHQLQLVELKLVELKLVELELVEPWHESIVVLTATQTTSLSMGPLQQGSPR